MRSAPSLQPFDAHALAAYPAARTDLSGIAAASSRRAPPSTIAPDGAGQSRRRLAAPRPLTWVLIGLSAWGLLIGGRAQIVRAIPAVAPLYSAVGLGVNLRQMDIANVQSRLADEDGRQILIVEGDISNRAPISRAAPRMRLSVLDDKGLEIYFWTAAPAKARLAPGETAQFRARLAAPPKEGREVRVRFVGETEAMR